MPRAEACEDSWFGVRVCLCAQDGPSAGGLFLRVFVGMCKGMLSEIFGETMVVASKPRAAFRGVKRCCGSSK